MYYIKEGDSPKTIIIPNALYLYDDFKFLTGKYTCIFYDLRNRGRSERIEDSLKLKDGIMNDVKDLETIRKYFDIEKPIVLGHSYLGLMTALYASEFSNNVSRLIQIGPLSINSGTVFPEEYTYKDEITELVYKELAELEASETNKSGAEYCKEWWRLIRKIYVTDSINVGRISKICCEYENEWPENQLPYLSNYIFESIQKLNINDDDIKKIDMPVLVVHGKKDRVAPYGGGREWASRLPNARLISIEDGGHFPWLENYALVKESIISFLLGDWPESSQIIN